MLHRATDLRIVTPHILRVIDPPAYSRFIRFVYFSCLASENTGTPQITTHGCLVPAHGKNWVPSTKEQLWGSGRRYFSFLTQQLCSHPSFSIWTKDSCFPSKYTSFLLFVLSTPLFILLRTLWAADMKEINWQQYLRTSMVHILTTVCCLNRYECMSSLFAHSSIFVFLSICFCESSSLFAPNHPVLPS